MAEVVDAIIADLIVRGIDRYEENMRRAIAVNDQLGKSGAGLAGASGPEAYAARNSKAAQQVEAAATRRAAADKRASKATEDAARAEQRARDVAEKASAREAAAAQRDADRKADAAKKAADAVAAAAAKEEAARARLAEVVDRGVSRSSTRYGPRDNAAIDARRQAASDAATPKGPTGQSTIPLSVLNGGADAQVAAEAEAVKEVNHLRADTYDLQQKVKVAEGETAVELNRQLEYLRRISAYKAAGLEEDQAVLRAEREMVAMDALRARRPTPPAQRSGGLGAANQFALGATGGRFGYSFSTGAVAGIGLAIGAGVLTEAIQQSAEYGQKLKEVASQTGLTTAAIQELRYAGNELGVSAKDVDAGLAGLNKTIGQAATGTPKAQKALATLGVSVADLKSGSVSVNDVLLKAADNIAKIQNPAKRSAEEVALFGDAAGPKLDRLLTAGSGGINKLRQAAYDLGIVLSEDQIENADRTAAKLDELKSVLSANIAGAVANNAAAIYKIVDAITALINAIPTALRYLDELNQRFEIVKGYKDLSVSLLRGDTNGAKDAAQSITDNQRGLRRNQILDQYADLPAEAKQRFIKGIRPETRKYLGLPDPAGDSLGAGGGSGNVIDNTPKGPKGKSAETLAKEAAAREKNYQDQLARLTDEELSAKAQQTQDEQDRLDIQSKQLNRDYERQSADIKLQVQEKRLTADRGALLQKQLDQTHAEQRNVLSLQSTLLGLSRDRASSLQRISFQESMAQVDQAFARTAKDRLDIELHLLKLARDKETVEANDILRRAEEGDPGVSKADRDAARETLRTQNDRFGRQKDEARQRNMGPWDTYVDSLPRTANDIETAFEQAEVNGVERLNNGLDDSISKLLKLHGVAGEFLKDLIQIGLHAAEAKLFGGGQFGQTSGGGGGLFGGLLNGIAKLFGGGGGGLASVGSDWGSAGSAFSFSSTSDILSSLPGYANGGSAVIGGNGGIDRNILSINGVPKLKVGRGELLSVTPPNVAASNARVNAPAPQVTVLAPQHFDLSNAVMTTDLVAQLTTSNRAYADAVGRASYGAAVRTAAGQAPSVLQTYQTLKQP